MLVVEDMQYCYGTHKVLRGLNLKVAPGVTVLFGPNGSGKSTLFSLLATRRHITHGDVMFDDLSWKRRKDLLRVRAMIGYVPQENCFDPSQTVHEFVAYCGWMHGMSTASSRSAVPDALKTVDLVDREHDKMGSLSGGMKRRAMIASAIVHQPQILILDEPTAGLDPRQQTILNTAVDHLGDQHIHVLLATHLVSDIAAADQVGFVDRGVVSFIDTPESILANFGSMDAAYAALTAEEQA